MRPKIRFKILKTNNQNKKNQKLLSQEDRQMNQLPHQEKKIKRQNSMPLQKHLQKEHHRDLRHLSHLRHMSHLKLMRAKLRLRL